MASSTRQTLIDTAFELFGRHGFHGVGLDRIIDTAGVSKQTFYNHFESKDDLVLAVLRHRHGIQSDMLKQLLRQLGGDDACTRLAVLFDALEAWFNAPEWRGCIFMNAAAEFPSPQEPAHQAAAEHDRAFVDMLQYEATLAKAHDPKKLAEDLSVVVNGVIARRHVNGDREAANIGRRFVTRLLKEQIEDFDETTHRCSPPPQVPSVADLTSPAALGR